MARDEDLGDGAEPSRSAVVAQLFADDGFGFLLTDDGREVRFTRDAVLRDEFDEMRVGSEVLFSQRQDRDGASARVVDLQSVPLPDKDSDDTQLGADDEVPEMPDLWQEK